MAYRVGRVGAGQVPPSQIHGAAEIANINSWIEYPTNSTYIGYEGSLVYSHAAGSLVFSLDGYNYTPVGGGAFGEDTAARTAIGWPYTDADSLSTRVTALEAGGGVGEDTEARNAIGWPYTDPNTLSERITTLEGDVSTKANLASPAFTGTPTAPTAAAGTNTTQIATTAFVLANGGSTLVWPHPIPSGSVLVGNIPAGSGLAVTNGDRTDLIGETVAFENNPNGSNVTYTVTGAIYNGAQNLTDFDIFPDAVLSIPSGSAILIDTPVDITSIENGTNVTFTETGGQLTISATGGSGTSNELVDGNAILSLTDDLGAGDSFLSLNQGRDLVVQGANGDGTAGNGRDLILQGGEAFDTDDSGGQVTIRGGEAFGTGSGGQVRIDGGTTEAGNPGVVVIRGGNSSTLGGNVDILGGDSSGGVGSIGGEIAITAGDGEQGGAVALQGGNGAAAFDVPGIVNILGGGQASIGDYRGYMYLASGQGGIDGGAIRFIPFDNNNLSFATAFDYLDNWSGFMYYDIDDREFHVVRDNDIVDTLSVYTVKANTFVDQSNLVVAAVAAGQNQVIVTGEPTQSAGSYVAFGTQTVAYFVTATVYNASLNQTTLALSPALFDDVMANDVLRERTGQTPVVEIGGDAHINVDVSVDGEVSLSLNHDTTARIYREQYVANGDPDVVHTVNHNLGSQWVSIDIWDQTSNVHLSIDPANILIDNSTANSFDITWLSDPPVGYLYQIVVTG